ncbi:MAG: phosphoenolpyruvate synthase [Candidatus Dadabacteria bacterium]|nr:MAG: phosphoenolpyruvate synthase [Candidatus Dadabacteria bacterium]
MAEQPWILEFSEIGIGDVPLVGGKNASLGEMLQQLGPLGVRVPDGFATTAAAWRHFITATGLTGPIRAHLDAMGDDLTKLSETGAAIRRLILNAQMPDDLADAIARAYTALEQKTGRTPLDVAVRSSATAEDLPDASFAGQQETFLNVRGANAVITACQRCYASLFTDRAIAYRIQKGFDHMSVALSCGVQRMVRSDRGASGVMFTLDTETGFPGAVVINGVWGLGETIVQGEVEPDEFVVFKDGLRRDVPNPVISRRLGSKRHKMIYGRGEPPTKVIWTTHAERECFVIDDAQAALLGRWACQIEDHYGRPMDIEWALDGLTDELFIVQARPETVHAREAQGSLRVWHIDNPPEPVVTGIAVGSSVATGRVRIKRDPEDDTPIEPGDILVAPMTDPDWVPWMKIAAAIVTDEGGRTCHAAIVARELGIPAVVGTGDATTKLHDGDLVTVSCAQGATGMVYPGEVAARSETIDLSDAPETNAHVMVNIGSPDAASKWWALPADGIGLARMEFIVGNLIGVHPMAILHPDRVDADVQAEIARRHAGWDDPVTWFVEQLAGGIARIAVTRYPDPVVLRTSDFKTNEYASLVGGSAFEPVEHNPMLGFRGASRYIHPAYREGFLLECRAIRHVREQMGLDNLIVMIPFCRTLDEADAILETMAEAGLERGKNGLKIYVMAEIPANVILAEEFAARFDGFSIGSNDLTQLVLGVDRDNDLLASTFDERNPAVKQMIADLIERAHSNGRTVGICGQAPSDHEGYAEWLVQQGIDSISVNPDRLMDVRKRVAATEAASQDPQ